MRKAGWEFAAIAVTAAFAVLVMAAGIFAAVAAGRPLPAPAMKMDWVTPQHQPATARLAWPAVRQSAVTVSGLPRTWQSGGKEQIPIASVAKIMTAYLVLKDHPLKAGEPGPSMTVTAADKPRPGESSAKVTPGETLTELEALEALMLPSADNIARLLATWDAGSIGAFTAKMNAQARAFGMNHTDYTDPSGLDDDTVSTARDQLIIVQKAMKNTTFAGIVAMPSAQIPVAGHIRNYNRQTGTDGIIGVKTGSDSAAGSCWAFAVNRTVAGTNRVVYGVVLGAPLGGGTNMAAPAISDGVVLASDVSKKAVKRVSVLPAGTVVGRITVPWSGVKVPVATTRALTGLALSGTKLTLNTVKSAPDGSFTANTQVATITVSGLVSGTSSTPVVAKSPSGEPNLTWRVFHN